MFNRNFAQRYPKHIRQFVVKDVGKWYAVNVQTNHWHCRINPDQETKDFIVNELLTGSTGVFELDKLKRISSYNRIFS